MQQPNIWPKAGPRLARTGYLLAIAGLISFKVFGRSDPAFALAGVVCLVLGGVAAVTGNLMSPKQAEEILEVDKRPPIVLLRPFRNESSRSGFRIYRYISNFGGYFQNVYSSEEILSDILSGFGPFITLGRPGEEIATPGAARKYVDHSEWQAVVVDWLAKAGLVIVQIGDTPSLLWELGRVVEKGEPSRTLLYMPPDLEVARILEYQNFRSKAAGIFRERFPEEIGNSIFIKFDENWKPFAVPFRRLKIGEYIRIAVKTRLYKSFLEVAASLVPVLNEIFCEKVEIPGVDLEKLRG